MREGGGIQNSLNGGGGGGWGGIEINETRSVVTGWN